MYYKEKKQWLKQHPSYNSEDNFYQLSREDQVIMVHLRTGHCTLRHHLHIKLHIWRRRHVSLWHGSNDSGTPPARLYYTPKREEGNLAYRNTSKRKDLWPTGGSAAHSDRRTKNRSPCLSVRLRRINNNELYLNTGFHSMTLFNSVYSVAIIK